MTTWFEYECNQCSRKEMGDMDSKGRPSEWGTIMISHNPDTETDCTSRAYLCRKCLDDLLSQLRFKGADDDET